MKNEISRREEKNDDDDDKRFQTNKGKCFPVSNFCSCEVGTLFKRKYFQKTFFTELKQFRFFGNFLKHICQLFLGI